MISMEDQLEYFSLKNHLIEYELQKIQNSGIDIGHKKTETIKTIPTDVFPPDIVNKSKKMAEHYAISYIVENSLRVLIRDTLSESDPSWLENLIPDEMLERAKKHRKEEEEFGIEPNEDILTYLDFGDLIVVLQSNKRLFENISDINKAISKLYTMKQSRNMIAHGRDIDKREEERIRLAVEDWTKIAY